MPYTCRYVIGGLRDAQWIVHQTPQCVYGPSSIRVIFPARMARVQGQVATIGQHPANSKVPLTGITSLLLLKSHKYSTCPCIHDEHMPLTDG